MKKKFFLSALVISLFGLAATKPVQADTSVVDIQKKGELVVGVKQDVPNFGYKDPKTGTYSGIETDLAKMVADELKVKVRYVPVTAQTRGPLLDNEQVDMDIATFTITDERKKLYNFTSPYYTDASGFLVNKSAKIKSIEDLNGKTIGVAQGSITQRLITELGKKKGLTFKFVELGSYPELITSLHAHRIDAFSVDRSILSGYISKRTELLDDSFKPSDYGIVTKKSNTGNFSSISANNSNGSLISRSTLLMNVKIGIPRIRQTLKSFNVCASIPFAPSITITALSTAIRVRYVSSEKSSCPGVSRILIILLS